MFQKEKKLKPSFIQSIQDQISQDGDTVQTAAGHFSLWLTFNHGLIRTRSKTKSKYNQSQSTVLHIQPSRTGPSRINSLQHFGSTHPTSQYKQMRKNKEIKYEEKVTQKRREGHGNEKRAQVGFKMVKCVFIAKLNCPSLPSLSVSLTIASPRYMYYFLVSLFIHYSLFFSFYHSFSFQTLAFIYVNVICVWVWIT